MEKRKIEGRWPQSRRCHAADSCTSWCVCLAGFLSSAIVHGSCYTFGILYPALLLQFKQSKGTTALVGSLAMSFICFFGLAAAKLINRFGCRVVTIFGGLICAASLALTSLAPNILVMFLTYSVLFGFGACCVYSAVYCEIPRHFHKWRSTAIGFMACGPGAGLLIMSPMVQAFQASLGWKGTYLSLAAISVSVCLLGCTFNLEGGSRQQLVDTDSDTKEDPAPSKTVSIFKNSHYLIYVLSHTILMLPIYVPIIHMAKYVETIGIGLEKSSQLYLISGLSDVCTRLASGWLSDSKWITTRLMYQISILLVGVSTLLLPLATSFISLLIYFVLWGLAAGTIGTCIAILLLSSVHRSQLAQAFGLWNVSISAAMSVGPPFAGFLADKFESYVPVFYWSGALLLVGGCVLFIHNCSCFTKATIYVPDKCTLIDKLEVFERETVL